MMECGEPCGFDSESDILLGAVASGVCGLLRLQLVWSFLPRRGSIAKQGQAV